MRTDSFPASTAGAVVIDNVTGVIASATGAGVVGGAGIVDRAAAEVAADIDRTVAGRTLLDAFQDTVARHGDIAALRWREGGAWRAMTWRELRDRVEAATLGLLAAGLRPGDRVGILMGNRPELAVADLAVLHALAVPVCLFETFTDDQLAQALRICGITRLIAGTPAELDRLVRAAGVAGVAVDGRAIAVDGSGWRDLVATGEAAARAAAGAFAESRRRARPDDVVSINFTSGTTGSLKGVRHTHRNVLWHAESFARLVAVPAGTRFLSYLTRAHATERFANTWFPLVRGATVSLCPDPAELLDYLRDVRPELLFGVQRVWERLYAGTVAATGSAPAPAAALLSAAIRAGRRGLAAREVGVARSWRARAARPVLARLRARLGLDACRVAFSGGGALAVEVQEFFNAVGVPLSEAWGQSELVSAAACAPPGSIRVGTVGRPLPGVAVRMAPDGELLVRSGSRMAGYAAIVDAALTDAAPDDAAPDDDGGWLATGDLGTVAPDGTIRVLGRRGDVVTLAGGRRVSAARMESQLRANLLVDHACVFPAAVGELHALLVPTPAAADASVRDLAGVVAESNRRLGPDEQISRFAVLDTHWTPGRADELTHTMKLRRGVVLERYAEIVDAMAAGRAGTAVPRRG